MAYSDIKDPSVHFQTALYTGNGGTLAVTNDGNSNLQPDLVWTKCRSGASHHTNVDSSRGAGKQIYPNLTYQEETVSGVSGFNTDGFTLGNNGTANSNGATYVAWQWKANGGTTTSVSASGTGSGCVNACTHQANTTAGFSIITYTGRDDQLNNAHESKLTHGLGVAPKAFICKRRDSADDWFYMGGDQATTRQGWYNGFLSLNDTDAVNGNHYVSNTQPDSTHIYLGNEKVNIASASYIGYAFAEKQGYSKFGKYVGNGADDGPFAYTGFKPAFLMMKESSSAGGNWVIFDTKRDPQNVTKHRLHPNTTAGDNTSRNYIDLYSNGFKMRNTDLDHNQSGETMIYMAFAESPFVANGVPATAR